MGNHQPGKSSGGVVWSGGFDEEGRRHGSGSEYDDHTKQTRRGWYEHGRYYRQWNLFDKDGKHILVEHYDINGYLTSSNVPTVATVPHAVVQSPPEEV